MQSPHRSLGKAASRASLSRTGWQRSGKPRTSSVRWSTSSSMLPAPRA